MGTTRISIRTFIILNIYTSMTLTTIIITTNVLKCSDDTIFFRKVNTGGDKQHLQKDLDKLVKWSEKMTDAINFFFI